MSSHSGTAPLTIQFQNETTGQTTGFLWDFDDGKTSTAFNPVHVFDRPGTYNVTLTATGDGGNNVTMHTIVVETPAPHAFFSASLESGDAPLTVGFTNESTGGFASGWLWSFGDGQTSNSEHVTHTFSNPGTYNVTLTATGTDVPPSVYTKTIEVLVPAPIAKWEPDTWYGQIPLTVNFQNLTTGQGPISYLWEFGEGEGTSTEAEPTHTYNTYGTYSVVLTATGADGRSTQYMQLIGANLTPTTAFSVSPIQGDAPLTVDITNKTTGQVTSWNWQFGQDGDLGSSSLEDPGQFTFNDPGIYPIVLTAVGNAGTSVVSRDITVFGDDPVASFTVPANIRVGESVTIINNSTNAVSYDWSWGNGLSSSVSYDGATSSPAYTATGDFTITLTATSTSGAQNTASHTFTVSEASSSPKALFDLKFTDSGDIGPPHDSGQNITSSHGLETIVNTNELADGSPSKVLHNIDNATNKIPNRSRIKIYNRSIPGSTADPLTEYQLQYDLGDAALTEVVDCDYSGSGSMNVARINGVTGNWGGTPMDLTVLDGVPIPQCHDADGHAGALVYFPQFSIKTGNSAVVKIKLTVKDSNGNTDSIEKAFRIWDLAAKTSASDTPKAASADIEAWRATYLGPYHEESNPIDKVTEDKDGGKIWNTGTPFDFYVPNFGSGDTLCDAFEVMVWRMKKPPSWLTDILKDRTYDPLLHFGTRWHFYPGLGIDYSKAHHTLVWKNGCAGWGQTNNMQFNYNLDRLGGANDSPYNPVGKSWTVTRTNPDYNKLRLTYVKKVGSNLETLGVEYSGNTAKDGNFTGDDLSEIQVANKGARYMLDSATNARSTMAGTPSHSWYGYRIGFFDEMWTDNSVKDATESNEIVICERPDDLREYNALVAAINDNDPSAVIATRKGLGMIDGFGWIVWLYDGKGVPYIGDSPDLGRNATSSDVTLWEANHNGKYVVSHTDYAIKKCGKKESAVKIISAGSASGATGANWDNIGATDEIINTGTTSAGTADFTIGQYTGRGNAHIVRLENISKDSNGKCVRNKHGASVSGETKIGGWKWTFDTPKTRATFHGGRIWPTSKGHHARFGGSPSWGRIGDVALRPSETGDPASEKFQHRYIYSRLIHDLWYSTAGELVRLPGGAPYEASFDGPWKWAKGPGLSGGGGSFPYPISENAIFTGGPVGAYSPDNLSMFKNTSTGYLICQSGDTNIVEHSFAGGIYYPSSLGSTCKASWITDTVGPTNRYEDKKGWLFLNGCHLYASKKGAAGWSRAEAKAAGGGSDWYTADNWWQGDIQDALVNPPSGLEAGSLDSASIKLQEGTIYQIGLEIWPIGGREGDPRNSIKRKTFTLPAGVPTNTSAENYWPSNSLIHLDLLMRGWKYQPDWASSQIGWMKGCWISANEYAKWSPPHAMSTGFWFNGTEQSWGSPV